MILTYVNWNTITGRLITAALEQHQLATGQISPLIYLSLQGYHHLTCQNINKVNCDIFWLADTCYHAVFPVWARRGLGHLTNTTGAKGKCKGVTL